MAEIWPQTFSPADSTNPIRLMLVWTDAPGHGLVGSTPAWNNDLNLSAAYNGQIDYGSVYDLTGWSTPGSFEDQDEDPLAYSASLLSGEGLPGWLSFNPGTRTFSGEPLEAGVYQIRITPSDGFDEISTGFELEVLQISTVFLPIVTR